MINSKLLSLLLLLSLMLLGNTHATANTRSISECSSLSIKRVTADKPATVYFVVFDAGSTGTRAVVHKFQVTQKQPASGGAARKLSFEYISATRFKRKPGLSSFARFPNRCREQLRSLLADVSAIVPADLRPSTCLLLRATAGFRLMKAGDRRLVSNNAQDVLQSSDFCVPAKGSVRMLSGAEEGKFTWLSVNYLLGRIGDGGVSDQKSSASAPSTRPVLELGGGSLQVSYELASGGHSLGGSRLRALSYLGLGIRDSVLRFLGHHNGNGRTGSKYRSPCLANGLSKNFSFGAVDIQIEGTGARGDRAAAAACLARGRRIVTELNVQQEPSLRKQAKWPIYAISGLYYLVKYLHDNGIAKVGRVDNACRSSSLSCRAYNATVGHISRAAQDACLQLPDSGEYEPYYCINLAVISAVLTDAWKLDASTPLVALGKQNALGWSLGLSMYHLTGGAAAEAQGLLSSIASILLTAASHGLAAALTAIISAAVHAG